jgi:AraC-like DNA-binding protein
MAHMTTILPIPPSAQRFVSDDLDEVRELTSRWAHEESRVVQGVGALRFELAWCLGQNTALAWGSTALAQTTRGAVNDPSIHLMVPEGTEYLRGRRRMSRSAGMAMVLAPGEELSRRAPPGRTLALLVRRDRLEAELAGRLMGQGAERRLRSTQVVLTPAIEVAVTGFLHAWPDAAAAPAALAHREADLVQAVAALLLGDGGLSGEGEATRARVDRLASWIDAHLDEALTVGRLCEVAQVGERALQKSFEHWRGMSPMRFVLERRLQAARRGLLLGGEGASVTRVALGLGFHHMGRFAMAYRELFGEPPSRTRGRALRR